MKNTVFEEEQKNDMTLSYLLSVNAATSYSGCSHPMLQCWPYLFAFRLSKWRDTKELIFGVTINSVA